MTKDKAMIFLGIFAVLVLGYLILVYTKIAFELKDDILYVNIHDTVNLKSMVLRAKDNNNKNLLKKIKYSGIIGDDDKLDGELLYIGDFSTKTITYTLKYKFKTIKKTITIVVVSDPNDPSFRPNYDYDSKDVNNDDDINTQVNTNLSNNQKKYVESLLK